MTTWFRPAHPNGKWHLIRSIEQVTPGGQVFIGRCGTGIGVDSTGSVPTRDELPPVVDICLKCLRRRAS